MGLLKVIEDAPGFLKATLQGPQGSGKTRTAVELACTAHKLFGSTKPVAFFDTESGSDYIAQLIEKYTGMKPLRVKTRGFSEMMAVVKECEAGAADVLIIDSITHVWRELQDAYMRRVNQGRQWPKTRMDIQDIMQIKELWKCWPDEFLNSPLHIVVCGREGNEWGNQENEETGKLELVQVGKKMKVEAEFGYEAALMISMSIRQVAEGLVKRKGAKGQSVKAERRARRIVNVATVLKDRFDAINGKSFEFPNGDSFLPHLTLLNPRKHGPVDSGVKSDGELPNQNDCYGVEKRRRQIACEEIQGLLVDRWPGQTAIDKKAKADILWDTFETRSWTAVEGMSSTALRDGLDVIRERLGAANLETAAGSKLGNELAEAFSAGLGAPA